MIRKTVFVMLILILSAGLSFSQVNGTANKSPDQAKPKTMEEMSKEDILAKLNLVLEHNPKILEEMPTIKKEIKNGVSVFSIQGKELGSLSKEELIAAMRSINPIRMKIQQERLKKQMDQISKAAQQQSQMRVHTPPKPPTVYVPPAAQTIPTAAYKPPPTPPSPPKR